jgi:3-isopropylmalate/(R)-2-methylmalate dehydratase large subunit
LSKPRSSSLDFGANVRVLYIAKDPGLVARQLAGEALAPDPDMELCEGVSTDEIIPAHACYYIDERLSDFVYTGLRGGAVGAGAVRSGGFSILVSGRSHGSGSSREAAPFAELAAGIRLVCAPSIERIYRQNCHNIGLLTTTDFSIVERLLRGENPSIDDVVVELDPLSAAIVRGGGLFSYNRDRMAGRAVAPIPSGGARPMTLAEKIIAPRVVTGRASRGVPSVRPGDAVFVETDVRFTHEYVTAMADALFRRGFGEAAEIDDPASVFVFRDHLTLLSQVMPDEHRALGLDVEAGRLTELQNRFVQRHRLRLYGERERNGVPAGSDGICHNKVVEEIAMPGEVVIGTDSHTCTAGALGCLAFGVGSTDMANAWFTKDVRVVVPPSVRVVLSGVLPAGTCAKDLMLELLARSGLAHGHFLGRVLEFSGPGLAALNVDERATLANMAVEMGAFSGIVEADAVTAEWLSRRGVPSAEVEKRMVRADEGAEYERTVEIDLATIEPMVALPGDPRSGRPLRELIAGGAVVPIDIAYGGTCTGGKRTDMDLYAGVLSRAVAAGLRVSPGVRFFIQFGSHDVRRYAEERGYLRIFEQAGATLLDPACGACIRAGPGTSERPDQVTVSAGSRNYPGRSGPGRVYLSSPLVVAASALAGRLTHPSALPDVTPTST